MAPPRILQAYCPQCGGRIQEHPADWRCARCDFKLSAFRSGERRDIEDVEREVQNIADEIAGAERTIATQVPFAPEDTQPVLAATETTPEPPRDHAALARLEPAYALLKTIQESRDGAKRRLKRFRREFIPTLTAIAGTADPKDPFFDNPDHSPLADSAAALLRCISIDAWNETELKHPPFPFIGDIVDSRTCPRVPAPDLRTATEANQLAIQYARYPDLKKRLLADQRTIRKANT